MNTTGDNENQKFVFLQFIKKSSPDEILYERSRCIEFRWKTENEMYCTR